MATKMYMKTSAKASTHLGTNNARADGTADWWRPYVLETAVPTIGAQAHTCNTVTGPTNGVEIRVAGISNPPAEWISEPLAADVTISGTVTLNVWAGENNMSANATVRVIIQRLNSQGAIASTILDSSFGTELGTTVALSNWTGAPTSTAMNRGDRIRVRIVADDATAVTMATGFIVTVNTDGQPAGTTGDTWVQFTENLTFETGPTQTAAVTTGSSALGLTGDPFGNGDLAAMSFIPAAAGELISLSVTFTNANGSPADTTAWSLQTDAAGVPSGVVLASGLFGPGPLLGALSMYPTPGKIFLGLTTYWIVLQRSGPADGTNFNNWQGDSGLPYANGVGKVRVSGGAWNTSIDFKFSAVTATGSRYFLTDTAEVINPGSAIEKKALTTRGSSSVFGQTTVPSNGPVAPFQATDTGGGTAIEWYTPPLNAFSLGGRAQVVVWAQSSPTANVSLRAEIAVVNGDGSGAVIWGAADVEAVTTNGSVGELPNGAPAPLAWPAGDDLTVTSGQRLRFRLYFDDCGDAPIVSGAGSPLVYYNGPTPVAAGDTYVILPVAVAELTGSPVRPYSAVQAAVVRAATR